MELLIISTQEITLLDGVVCRVWEGITPGGVECYVLVHRIAVRREADTAEFDAELLERAPPASPLDIERKAE